MISRKYQNSPYSHNVWTVFLSLSFLNLDTLPTYLSHSSTLNVGVVVVGVGGELCLLTR